MILKFVVKRFAMMKLNQPTCHQFQLYLPILRFFTSCDQQVSLVIAQQVLCDTSPFSFAFDKHHACKIVIDSGATSSLIQKSFIKAAGILERPHFMEKGSSTSRN